MVHWSITQLQYIVAVDEHRSFSKAAAAVHVTQPTLSTQVQKLEEDLGAQIFDRSKKPIRPTEIGELILAQARSALAEIEKIEWVVKNAGKEATGDFHLGVLPTLAPYIVPRFLKAFEHGNPKLKLHLHELRMDAIVESVDRGQIDAGLLITPIHSSELIESPIFYEPFYLFLQSSHPLAQKEAIRAEEIDVSELWLLENGHCLRQQMLALFGDAAQGLSLQKSDRFAGGSLETLISLVRRNGGYALIPELALPTPMPEDVKAIPFQKPTPVREVSLVYRRRTQLKLQVVETLKQIIASSVPDHLTSAKSDGLTILPLETKQPKANQPQNTPHFSIPSAH